MPTIFSRQLTDATIRALRPVPGKTLRRVDGNGLQLLVHSNGVKRFQLRNQRSGQAAKPIDLGTFPEMTIAAARRAAEVVRNAPVVASGADGETFGAAFDHWYRTMHAQWKRGYAQDIFERISFNTKTLTDRPLRSIKRPDMLNLLEAICARGAHIQARRVRALVSDIFEYSIQREWTDTNPATRELLKAMPRRPRVEHHAAARFEDMPAVIKTIETYPSRIVSAALRFLILTAARTNEVRLAAWDEIDLGRKVWVVPAERMKAGRQHVVPLSVQAVQCLTLLPRTSERWLFPTLRADRPMSENALLYALQGMGFEFTVHGFRSTFSTWANDNRVAEPDIIEAALAHTVPGVRGAYDRGNRFTQRIALMQSWADAITPQLQLVKGGRRATA